MKVLVVGNPGLMSAETAFYKKGQGYAVINMYRNKPGVPSLVELPRLQGD